MTNLAILYWNSPARVIESISPGRRNEFGEELRLFMISEKDSASSPIRSKPNVQSAKADTHTHTPTHPHPQPTSPALHSLPYRPVAALQDYLASPSRVSSMNREKERGSTRPVPLTTKHQPLTTKYQLPPDTACRARRVSRSTVLHSPQFTLYQE